METPASTAAGDAVKERLSPAFNRLWVAAITSNLADGVGRVAVPLIAATTTRDPAAIAVLGAVAVLPWLLFGVMSGVIVDRVDRRKAMAAANALRVAAAAGLGALVLADSATLPWLCVATFIFSTGETLFDNATNAMIPAVVKPSLRDSANSRIQAAQVAVDLFVATPIGSALFALAVVVPLAVGGGGYAVAAVLALALPAIAARSARATRGAGEASAEARDAGADGATAASAEAAGDSPPKVTAREGIRYWWGHPYLRNMTIMTSGVAALLTFAQASSILLFLDTYGVPTAALGLVTSAIGLGGLGGSLIAPALVARWGRARVMLGATVVGGLGLLAVALSPSVWLAMLAYAIGAGGVSAWNVPWASARQAVIPGRLMGTVVGFARTIAWGLIPLASVAGGFVGRIDLQLPFAIGGAGTVVVALLAARLILSTDAQAPVEPHEDDASKQASPPAPAVLA